MREHHHDPLGEGHGHTHGLVDPTIATTSRGIWAIKWSFTLLAMTAALQIAVLILSGSIALFADTIHNAGDALTAIPLWVAFLFARRAPTRRFTYGFGRVEDLAGVVIVGVILFSAIIGGYESVRRLIHPQQVSFIWAVAAAGGIGFLGNEAVAVFRIRVGREIQSAALIADGYHARTDGFTSLAVLVGALGVWAGYPIADPIVGLLITALIVKIVWDSAKSVFARALDAVDPEIIDGIEHEASHVPGVLGVGFVRARWIGHRLYTEVHVTAASEPALSEAHALAVTVAHRLSHRFPFLADTVVHVDPLGQSGKIAHRVSAHEHDGLPVHAH